MPKISSILACSLLASTISFSAQALPAAPAARLVVSDIISVRGFCGLGFHRGPYGACVRNGVPYGYAAPVVMAPPYVAPVVAPRVTCPYGYYYYAPYGQCVPAR